MSIVARRRTKATVLMLTRQDKIDRLGSWKRLGLPQYVESCETPVEAVHPEVLRQPIFILVFLCVQALDIFHMSRRSEPKLVRKMTDALGHGVGRPREFRLCR